MIDSIAVSLNAFTFRANLCANLMSAENPTPNTISLLDLIAVLVKRRWFIVVSSFLAGLFVVLYSLYTLRAPSDARFNYLPNYYKPNVRIRLLSDDQSSISSILGGSNLGFLANIAGASAGGSSNAELAQTLIVSHRVLDELIAEFNIVERYGIDENPRTASREALKSGFEMEFAASTGILTISYESGDRVFATEILTSAVMKLESLFDELTMKGILEKKRFLAETVAQYETELRAAQKTLIDFQTKNNIIDISLQTASQLTTLADLERQILEQETNLATLKENRRPDDPEVLNTARELNLLKTRRDVTKLGQKDDANTLDIPLSELPGLSAVYANLLGDIEILQVIYSSLRSQLETTKIEEKDNSERFQIIEEAEIPEVKAGPSRGKICVIVTMSAFFLSVFIAFILEYFDRVKADPSESEKLAAIKQMLWKSRKKK
jgi:tyrosine-protein kinase Etk/Wzc